MSTLGQCLIFAVLVICVTTAPIKTESDKENPALAREIDKLLKLAKNLEENLEEVDGADKLPVKQLDSVKRSEISDGPSFHDVTKFIDGLSTEQLSILKTLKETWVKESKMAPNPVLGQSSEVDNEKLMKMLTEGLAEEESENDVVDEPSESEAVFYDRSLSDDEVQQIADKISNYSKELPQADETLMSTDNDERDRLLSKLADEIMKEIDATHPSEVSNSGEKEKRTAESELRELIGD